MTRLGFEFPVDSSGQWDGFNDPNIEHFAGNRLQHLGREVPQNTIDAKVTNPAQISVRLIKVPTASLPGHVELTEAVTRCQAAAADDQSDKAARFFQNAAKLLAENEIQVLQIRDANTTGLTGPCVNGTPFLRCSRLQAKVKSLVRRRDRMALANLRPSPSRTYERCS